MGRCDLVTVFCTIGRPIGIGPFERVSVKEDGMKTRTRSITAMVFLGMAALSSGCLDRELKALNPCLVSGVARKVAVTNVDFVDLLFMVDNSGSMRQEQGALKEQFPKLITTLTTGKKSNGETF